MVEKVCPDQTAATCLALLVSGNKDVVGLIRENLCIALDGCGKLCAKKATKEYSGKVDDAVVIDEILQEMGESLRRPEGISLKKTGILLIKYLKLSHKGSI